MGRMKTSGELKDYFTVEWNSCPQKGWQCPVCRTVYNPSVMYCKCAAPYFYPAPDRLYCEDGYTVVTEITDHNTFEQE